VAGRDQPAALLVAPHLAAEPAGLELGEPGAVVGEHVDDRVGRRELEQRGQVGGAEQSQAVLGPEHEGSLRDVRQSVG
jgi:hypothetical protein